MEPRLNKKKDKLEIPLDKNGKSTLDMTFGEYAQPGGKSNYSGWAKMKEAPPEGTDRVGDTYVFEATFLNQTWFGMTFRNGTTHRVKLNMELDPRDKKVLTLGKGQALDLKTLEKQVSGKIDSSRYFVYLDPLKTFEDFNFGGRAFQLVSAIKFQICIEGRDKTQKDLILPYILIKFRSATQDMNEKYKFHRF